MFGFSGKGYNVTAVADMRQIISELLKDERKEKLSDQNHA